MSAQVLDFSFQAMQNPNFMWMPGATAGEEDLVSLALIGKQGVSGHLRVFIDSTLRTLFTANTECEVTIVCVGATITGSYKRQVTLTIPHFKIPTIAFNEEGSTIAMQLNFTEDSVLKASGSNYASIGVRTTENSSKSLVAA